MKIGQSLIASLFLLLAGATFCLAQGPDQDSSRRLMQELMNRPGVNREGPLDNFVVNASSVDSHGSNAEQLIPVKPQRAPVDANLASAELLNRVSNDAPVLDYEPELVEYSQAPPVFEPQQTVFAPQQPAFEPQVPISAPAQMHHVPPQQVAPNHSASCTQPCRDEWANFCQPRRLDWECDCDQFPRPERTIHGGCRSGCRAAIGERRLLPRHQRLGCGCLNRCTGKCQSCQTQTCNDQPVDNASCHSASGTSKASTDGPGQIGFGALKKSPEFSVLDSQNSIR